MAMCFNAGRPTTSPAVPFPIQGRRELENYLYDPAVLQTFFENSGLAGLPDSVRTLLVDTATGEARYTRQTILVEVAESSNCRTLVPALKATEAGGESGRGGVDPFSTSQWKPSRFGHQGQSRSIW